MAGLVRRGIILSGIAALVAMSLFPPWLVVSPSTTELGEASKPGGYSFFVRPPLADRSNCRYSGRVRVGIFGEDIILGKELCGLQIDYFRLFTQWAVVATVVGGLFYLAGGGQPKMRREKKVK